MWKKFIMTLAGLLLSFALFSQNQSTFSNKEDSISYALGIDLGNNLFSRIKFDSFNYELFVKGLKDIQKEKKTIFTEEEAREVIQKYFMEAMEKEGAEKKKIADEFLAKNATKEDVLETESGLQYKVLKKGEGEKPQSSDRVKVHYTGKTLDGKIFDSSRERGEPIVLSLKNVIEGWAEGLKLMNKGARYKLFIPPELGYGERGAGNDIGPNELLIFDIELLDINPNPDESNTNMK